MDLALLCIALLAAAPAAPAGRLPPSPSPLRYKLKPGATGKVCLECHTGFGDKLQKAVVHTPVRSGEGVACHDPHASAYPKLRAGDGNQGCLGCHGALLAKGAKSIHAPVAKGACTACHDPHSSDQRFVLVRSQKELCAGCHGAITEAVAKTRVPHKALAEGCTSCHDPHASAKSP